MYVNIIIITCMCVFVCRHASKQYTAGHGVSCLHMYARMFVCMYSLNTQIAAALEQHVVYAHRAPLCMQHATFGT